MRENFDPFVGATTLLHSLGYSSPSAVLPLPGGRNNQVWRVELSQQSFLLKRYFWSEQDPRDRLGQEWKFLEYLWEQGCRQVPQPFIRDSSIRCALLEFIQGTPVPPQAVTPADVRVAADFFLQMNSSRDQAVALSPVSEACFSLEAHLATTTARVARLATIQPETKIHASVRDFVEQRLHPLAAEIERRIRSSADLTRVLPEQNRCLSPSDFGFHNCIRQSDGTLRFVDFEYAGWDDPAKTIIDFCNQPDGILSEDHVSLFRQRVIAFNGSEQPLQERVTLLEPLYQLKWACICLNGFLPGHDFDSIRPDRSPEAQLARARLMAHRAAARVRGEAEHRK